MMSCKESARLLSESRDRSVPFRKRLALRFHIVMCRMCQIYARQMNTVGRVCREAGEQSHARCPGELSAERKSQIKDALRRGD